MRDVDGDGERVEAGGHGAIECAIDPVHVAAHVELKHLRPRCRRPDLLQRRAGHCRDEGHRAEAVGGLDDRDRRARMHQMQ